MPNPWDFSELQRGDKPVRPTTAPKPVEGLQPAWENWSKAPTPQSMGQLLTAAKPMINTGLQRYGQGGAASPNLRSHAKRLAITAFTSYDPSRGDLQTHLMSRLQGLQRIAARSNQPIPLPEQLALGYQQLVRHESDYKDRFGRDPSDAELTELTGLSSKKIAKLRGYRPAISESQYTQGGSELPGRHTAASTDAWIDYLYHDMSPTDQLIVDYTLGRNGNAKLQTQEIAKRLGITVGAVSQRTAKLQKLVDMRHELSVI